MTRYRKRPVEIEARRVTRETFHEVGEWAGAVECWGLDAPTPAIHIETLEGVMLAQVGDWVVRGIQGEFYPVKDSIFRETYEEVGEP